MSSFMDDAYAGFQHTRADDVVIDIPALRDRREKDGEAAPNGPGEHGGSASEGGRSEAAAATSAPEPAPQRDDPDEGEHKDASAEEMAARAAQAADKAASEIEDEPEEEVEPEAPTVVTTPIVTQDEIDAESMSPKTLKQRLESTDGNAPRAFKRVGFSAGENTALVNVSRVPEPVIDRLRLHLAQSTGGGFAAAISVPALLSAFVMAKAGLVLDVDENTAVAAEAFRGTEPRLEMLEDRMTEQNENILQLARAMKISLKRVAETADVTDGIEFGLSYLLADRVSHISTSDVDETNVDVTHPKALRARETIRVKSRAQRTIERNRDGRRMQ